MSNKCVLYWQLQQLTPFPFLPQSLACLNLLPTLKLCFLCKKAVERTKRCVCSCLRRTTLPLAWNQDRLPPLSDLSDDCHRTTTVQTQEKVQHLEAQSIKYKLKKLSRNMNIQISIIYTLVLLKNKYVTQISPFRHRSRIYTVQVGGRCPILSKAFKFILSRFKMYSQH